MTTQTQVLPAPPTAVATPPRKTHHARNAGIAIAAFFVLAGIIANNTSEDGAPAPVAEPGLSVPDTDTTYELAATQAVPLLMEASSELGRITATSSISSDIGALNTAGDNLEEAAALFVGVDDEVSGYLSSAADHLYEAARAEATGDFAAMSAEIAAGTEDLQAAQAAVEGR